MQKVILYIQPKLRNTTTDQDYIRVDLMEEELIEITQVIQDIRDISKIFTDYSRTFNLPASKTNNKIFKHWYNPDIEGFDNQIFSNARIELNHLHFKFGKIKLEEAVLKHGEISMYKVTFFGNTLTLTDTIKDDKLQNLNWLNNFSFEASETAIKNGLETGINKTVDSIAYTNAMIYPLITHSQSYFYDDTNQLDNGLNLSDHSSHHLQRGVIAEDLKPAIQAKLIIKAIEEQYNYTFASGGFFDSDAMDNLYLWMHRIKGDINAPSNKTLNDVGTFSCTGFPSTACSHFDSGSPPFGPKTTGGVYIISDNFTNGQSEGFTYEVEILPTDSTIEYTLEIIDETTDTVYATLENVKGDNSLFIGFGPAQFFSLTGWVELPHSLNLTARVKSSTSMTFDSVMDCEHYVWNPSLFTYDVYAAEFTQDANATTNQSLIFTDQMPDIKVIDFLKSMFSIFNLTAYLNFQNEIVVQTLDDYYLSGNTHDITEYIKTDQHTVGATVPFNEIDLEYEEPVTILAEQFKNSYNKKYGEIEYVSSLEKAQSYNIKVPLEHMIFERLQDRTDGTFTTVQVGAFINDKLEPEIGNPLLFYGIRQTSGTPINFVFGTTRPATYGGLCATGSSNTTLTSYWIPSVCNELGTTSTPPEYNLNFGSEINTYNLTDYGGNNNSLFQNFYENYITRLFNKKIRLYKYSAILPLKILLQLNLNDFLVIGTRLFTINKMSTKLQSGETNFELLNEPSTQNIGISYDQVSYCTTDSDPTPTVEPAGGTFTAS